jgi:lipopolysaccharide biosynthesis glycosyltransferase
MNAAFLYCVDDAYAKHASVSIFSLLTSTLSRSFDICIIGNNLSPESCAMLLRLSDVFGVTIRIFDAEAHLGRLKNLLDDKDYRGIQHVSSATLIRLIFSDVLPDEYGIIVYVDADTIVQGDLSGFFEIELNGHIIAAARDVVISKSNVTPDLQGYFNAGVLVIDSKAWRKQDVCDALLKIWSTTPAGKLSYQDQDVLNYYFRKAKYCDLDIRFNYQFLMAIDSLIAPPEVQINDAAIIHYAGEIKPWHAWASLEYCSLYRSYRQVMPWLGRFSPDKPKGIRQLSIASRALLAQGRYEESARYSQQLIKALSDK